MAKKSEEVKPNTIKIKSFRVLNLTESMVPVPFYNEEGKTEFLQLRLQGRGGQVPPVLQEYMIGDGTRELQKKKMIRLERIED